MINQIYKNTGYVNLEIHIPPGRLFPNLPHGNSNRVAQILVVLIEIDASFSVSLFDDFAFKGSEGHAVYVIAHYS